MGWIAVRVGLRNPKGLGWQLAKMIRDLWRRPLWVAKGGIEPPTFGL